MSSKLLTILFLLPVIYARINIDISSNDDNDRDVRISGNQIDLITETEKKNFELTDENLKKSISSYFGSTPDSVYVQSPTPWGGLYKSLNWEPVKRVFLPKKAAILSVERKPVLLLSKNYFNEDSTPKTTKEQIRQTVENTMSSQWNSEGDLDVENIHYHFDMKKPEEPMYYSFSAKGGENVKKSMPVTVRSDLEFTVQPKQKVKANVLLTKETMKIKVDYKTSLFGNVAVNYDNEFKGHRFWAMDINTLLEAGGLKKAVESSEIIELVRYTDAKVLVKDAETQEVIFTAPLEMH